MPHRVQNFRLRWIAVCAVVCAGVYLVARVTFLYLESVTWIDRLYAFMLFCAEGHALLHAVGYALASYRTLGSHIRYRRAYPPELPAVVVVVPVRDEPLSVVERTCITLAVLEYPNCRRVLLDGSRDAHIREGNQALCAAYGIGYVASHIPPASKAGAINEFLQSVREPFLAVFDADQSPMPYFLSTVVPLILASHRIAYVQTPQVYANVGASPIAHGAAMQQSIFYELVCEAKQHVGAAFCCGTNVLLRVDALRAVGGFDESSVTEDFSTSLKLHLAGYRSLYYSHTLAFGVAPETLSAYFKQQMRWATGTIATLWPLVRAFCAGPQRLSFAVWWEYFLSASYYFVGIAFLVLSLTPAVFLLTGMPTYFDNPLVYLVTFVPYAVMNMTLFYGTMRRRHYSVRMLISGIVLGMVSFPVLIYAACIGLLRIRVPFMVTPKGRTGALPTAALWPWMLLIAVNGAACFAGALRWYSDPFAITVNIAWCCYTMLVVSRVFVLNADSPPVHSERVPPTVAV